MYDKAIQTLIQTDYDVQMFDVLYIQITNKYSHEIYDTFDNK